MALLGAGVGPVALAWGLQRTSGTSASLMLALEAVFTIALARVFYGEQLDRRVAAGMALLIAGGLALVLDQAGTGAPQAMGLLAVLAATAAWGADNALSRAVAERDPSQVVLVKAALGAGLTGALAVISREPWPAPTAAAALAVVGAAGYGLSLRVYLLAQRAFGAARTGSAFAFAPFIGALVAVGLGDRAGGWWMVLGGALMLGGVLLHLAESHSHEHTHESFEHEHAHVHDDGHHDHFHDVIPSGPHSHLHSHAPTTHSHAHVPDAHHSHMH